VSAGARHRGRRPGTAYALLAALPLSVAGIGVARADSAANARNAESEIRAVVRDAPTVDAAVKQARSVELTAEQRVANGEILYRTKDYGRATVVLSEVIEKYPNTPSHADALWLRGETFFASREYLAARRDYRALVELAQAQPRFQKFMGRALARIVDVSLRTQDPSLLDDVLTRLDNYPSPDGAIHYARGKAHYMRRDYPVAQSAFSAVPNGSEYTHQARYFQGLIALKQTRPASAAAPSEGAPPPAPTGAFKQAIDTFSAVTVLPPDTPEHRHVIDLAWMAIGRLFYEMEQYRSASDAYSRVGRESPEFDTMLYELAWVYVRMGDVQRAERALEILSVSNPDSPFLAEGSLLRADLLLRSGGFDKALKLYEGVRDEFDPIRAKVEQFIDTTKDTSVYYDTLAEQQLDTFEQRDVLPPITVRWAREAEDGPLAFAVIDDVNLCKTLINQSYQLIEKLNAVLGASNRVRAFPELLAGEERALGLINRVSRARLELARGLDEEEDADVPGELAQVRAQRRSLMGVVAQAPTNSAEFAERDRVGMKQWNLLSQELSRRSLEVDRLQAVVNGLRRMLKDDAQRGVARDANTLQRFNAEIDANERELKAHRAQIADVRRQIEIGRIQVGVGDARYQNDAMARGQFRDLLDREVELVNAGQAGRRGQAYAARIQPLLREARATEDRLAAAFDELETRVAARVSEVKGKVDVEAANISRYSQQLELLDGEARDLVGRVAERNFRIVRDRLRGLVLRADVGITEQAWEVREEELERVRALQTERARQEQLLDEELREVLDDAVEESSGGP
jgi:tetratricopeptide (TPR) repeat protein